MRHNVITFPATMDAQLRAAIANKRLIQFTYNNDARVAEPHDYGQRNGIDQLLVYQRKKARQFLTGWRSLEVSKIENLVVLEDTFRGTRNDPKQDHAAWDALYARVK